jgi:hypothetical protein
MLQTARVLERWILLQDGPSVRPTRIASKHFHFDRLELLSQMGALPAPAEV